MEYLLHLDLARLAVNDDVEHDGSDAVVPNYYPHCVSTGFAPRAGAVTRERCASWCCGGRGKYEENEVNVVQGRDGQGARLGKVGREDKTTSWMEALPKWAASRSTS